MKHSRLRKRRANSQEGLWHLGFLVGTQRAAVMHLLRYYRLPIPPQASDAALIEQLLKGVSLRGPEFHWDLAEMVEAYYPTEDSYLGKGGSKSLPASPALPGIQVGADPVSAIAGAIGSVANVVSFAQQRKNNDKLAQQQRFAALLNHSVPSPAPPPTVPPPTAAAPPAVDHRILLLGMAMLAAIVWFTRRPPVPVSPLTSSPQ